MYWLQEFTTESFQQYLSTMLGLKEFVRGPGVEPPNLHMTNEWVMYLLASLPTKSSILHYKHSIVARATCAVIIQQVFLYSTLWENDCIIQ